MTPFINKLGDNCFPSLNTMNPCITYGTLAIWIVVRFVNKCDDFLAYGLDEWGHRAFRAILIMTSSCEIWSLK